jgi:hypothetical protein
MSSACVCHLHKEEKSTFSWVSRYLNQPGKEAADGVASYGECLVIRSLMELYAMFKAIFFGRFLLPRKTNGPTSIKSNYDKGNRQCNYGMLSSFRQDTIEVSDSEGCVNFYIGLQYFASSQICEISFQQTLTLLLSD